MVSALHSSDETNLNKIYWLIWINETSYCALNATGPLPISMNAKGAQNDLRLRVLVCLGEKPWRTEQFFDRLFKRRMALGNFAVHSFNCARFNPSVKRPGRHVNIDSRHQTSNKLWQLYGRYFCPSWLLGLSVFSRARNTHCPAHGSRSLTSSTARIFWAI